MNTRLVYSPDYDLSLYGLEKLHPFDGRKYSRAWELIARTKGDAVDDCWERPAAPVAADRLRLAHTDDYLDALGSSAAAVARALEMPFLRLLPLAVLERRVLRPMRLAVQGTLLATEKALGGATAMNLGGGYHHAFPDHGEGFCLYADVPIAVAQFRKTGLLKPDDPILLIDLDAHRGNGFFAFFEADPAVHVFDLYNAQIYPGLFEGDEERHPFLVPIRAGTADDGYLGALRAELPVFLDSAAAPRLAFYNAGTDILAGDRLGGLAVSHAGVRQRDRLVIDALAERGIPTVVTTSGGYSAASHRLIAELAIDLIDRETVAPR